LERKQKLVNGYQRKRNAYRKCACEREIDGVLPFWAIFEVCGREKDKENEGN
jgi:abortive infection bacteriophage resistance protein